MARSAYPAEWSTRRREVLERDDDTCQGCGKTEALHVHHIDEDKSNTDPSNLVTLCRTCHNREHHHNGEDPVPDILDAFHRNDGYATTGYLVDTTDKTRPTVSKRLDRLHAATAIEYVHEPTALWRLVYDPREEDDT